MQREASKVQFTFEHFHYFSLFFFFRCESTILNLKRSIRTHRLINLIGLFAPPLVFPPRLSLLSLFNCFEQHWILTLSLCFECTRSPKPFINKLGNYWTELAAWRESRELCLCFVSCYSSNGKEGNIISKLIALAVLFDPFWNFDTPSPLGVNKQFPLNKKKFSGYLIL